MKRKEKILEIISEGKGIIPYKFIFDMESFFIKAENEFWEKTEFFNELKQSAVNVEDYGHSKYLYHTLKMRNLGDTYGFNPRKCNSASSMSSCIEREMSKIILALSAKYEHVEIFEETVIGGFSCINTRLAFDYCRI